MSVYLSMNFAVLLLPYKNLSNQLKLFDTMYNTEEIKDAFVPIGTFNKSRLRILNPITHSFTKGDSEIEWTTSEGRYVDDDGEECELFFELSDAFCFGVNGVYEIGTKKDDKIIENMKGLQMCYPLTGMKTIENPTKDEKYTQRILEALWGATWKKMQEECEMEELRVPNPSYNSYLAAVKRKNPEYAVKPVFAFPQKIDPKNSTKKIEDRSKPRRVFIKFRTKGEGRKMRCFTQIYGPGDRQDKTGLKYFNVRGRVHPVIKWAGVFWGSHGQKASHGASVRLRVEQMNYTPLADEIPKRRMLPSNSAPPIEEDNSDNEDRYDSTGEDEGFENPGDDENPADIIKGDGSESSGEDESEKISLPPRSKKFQRLAARRKSLLLKNRRAKKNIKR